MRELENRMIGDENSFAFEQRIFNFVILLSICIEVFGTLLDIYYDVGVAFDLMFTGYWILTYCF